MKRIIGYTDSITECECCGKTELKGTFCLEIDGVELYYGSVCAFKSHGVSNDDKKTAVKEFKAKVKKQSIISLLESMVTNCDGSDFSKSKILAFVNKKGLDINSFFKKYGEMVDDMTLCQAYTFGYKTIIINK